MSFRHSDAFAAGLAVGMLTAWFMWARAERAHPQHRCEQPAVNVSTPRVDVTVYETPNLGTARLPKKEARR